MHIMMKVVTTIDNKTKKPEQQPEQKTATASAEALSGRKIALILGCVGLVCATVIAVVYLLRSQPQVPQPVEVELASGRVITEENVREIEAQLQETIERGMFQTHMNTTWVFPNGSSPSSNARMGNSVNNRFPFYFTLHVGERLLFTSGMMPVGTEINEIVLDEVLDAGTYDAIVRINMFDDDGEHVESNMGFRVTLLVEA